MNSTPRNRPRLAFSFFYSNVRSIKNKVIELCTSVSIQNVDIICLSETWLTPDFANGSLNLSNYTIFRKDRDHRGGGVLIATKSTLKAHEIVTPGDDEILTLDLYNNSFKLLRIITIYNPNFNNLSKFKSLLKNLTKLVENQNEILLVGDFNLPLAFSTSKIQSFEEKYILFRNFIDKIQPINQCINFSTRGSNTLDLVFVRNKNKLIDLEPLPPIGNSDHASISGKYILSEEPSGKNNKVFYRNFKAANYSDMSIFLHSVLLSFNYKTLCAPDLWDFFQQTITTSINMFVPLHSYYIHNKNTYTNKEVNLFRQMKRNYKFWKHTNNLKFKRKFKYLKNLYKTTTFKNRLKMEKFLASKNNSNLFF